MITTVVCCICVTCTAAIASYGMSSLQTTTQSTAAVPSCMPFSLMFTSSCILVSASYYLIIKISILAMRALLSGGGGGGTRRRVVVAGHSRKKKNHDSRRLQKEEASASSEQQPQPDGDAGNISSVSPWSFSDAAEENTDAEHTAATPETAAAATKTTSSSVSIELQGSLSPSSQSYWSSSSMHSSSSSSSEFSQRPSADDDGDATTDCLESFGLDDDDDGEGKHCGRTTVRRMMQQQQQQQQQGLRNNERFTFLKVWTNVYGLAVGMFCIVYSLLLPNELSSFVFCSCLCIVGTYECVSQYASRHPCCGGGALRRRKGSRLRSSSSCCWCVAWLFSGAYSLLLSPPLPQHRIIARRRRATSPSSVLLLWLCMLLVVGIVFKAAGGVVSGRLWDGSSMADGVLGSLLIPMVGVAAIKNMQRTQDVRNTMELSMPVCSMGSLVCLLCLVLAGKEAQWCSCIASYFWETAQQHRYVNALPTISDANWSAVFAHAHRSDNVTVTASFLRHEPILSMFVMPFPLVCSVVAVVSCSRSDHIMDVAAAVFLAYSAKPFSMPPDFVTQTQSQDRQHIASLLGGLSMGIGACMCICLACYRMANDESAAVSRRMRRRALLLLDSHAQAQRREKKKRHNRHHAAV